MPTSKTADLLKARGSVWLSHAASVRLTLVCIVLGMMIVLIGTLAQVKMGTFAAQKVYFNSWLIYGNLGGFKFPVFLGGLSVGMMWMVNLIASFITRFKFRREEVGIYLTHIGLILLLLGQFLTQTLARETQMPIEIGHSSNFSESSLKTELAVIKTSDPEFDEVTSIPEAVFSHQGTIRAKTLPFELVIRRFIRNARLGMSADGVKSMATQGIGMQIAAEELPPVNSDNEANNVTAYVEVREGDRRHGVWLLSSGLGAPQSFTIQGAPYRMAIRPKRNYFPFTLTLKEFHHDRYPGTDIPKNFSSLVHLSNPETREDRTSLIYMNHPLRYAGYTFYQASFGEGDRLSVFQVVENPAALTPYVSCAIVALGLLIQFLTHLLQFVRKRS